MRFFDAIESGFRKYSQFSGRASRSEFWYWILFGFLGGIVIFLFDAFIFRMPQIRPLGILFSLAIIIPNISVTARRLHDINRSGWWQLLLFIPLIGWILLLIWECTKGNENTNRFGDNPLR
jgi:uncharacterized membrane protein YhaH (DUF805 family)